MSEVMPTNGVVQTVFKRQQKVAESIGIFDYHTKIYDWSARILQVQISVRSLSEEEYQEWIGFFLRTDGRVNTFLMTPKGGEKPAGAIYDEYGRWQGGPVLVNGADQTGKTLNVDGLQASQTNAFKAGDWFEIGGVLHEIRENASSNASGEATLKLWRSLGTAPADNTQLIIDNPQGTFRMTGDIPDIGWSAADDRWQGFKFTAKEVLS